MLGLELLLPQTSSSLDFGVLVTFFNRSSLSSVPYNIFLCTSQFIFIYCTIRLTSYTFYIVQKYYYYYKRLYVFIKLTAINLCLLKCIFKLIFKHLLMNTSRFVMFLNQIIKFEIKVCLLVSCGHIQSALMSSGHSLGSNAPHSHMHTFYKGISIVQFTN